MKDPQMEEFRHSLEALLANLEQPFRHREQIAIENAPDPIDQVQNASNRALAIRQLELDTGRQRALNEALGRIRDGSYGICVRCDAEISEKRLLAVPWTAYCLHCQEEVDLEERQASGEDLAINFMNGSL
jgi:DnaK suppressor protein